MTAAFAHLHVHTEYSLVDGLLRIDPLIKAVAEQGMPAIAITEQGNLFSLIKFYKAAEKYGIKPIAGAEVRVLDNDKDKEASNILLLCQNYDGYRNLCHLITRSYTDGQRQGVPYIHFDWLSGYSENLLAIPVSRNNSIASAMMTGKKNLVEVETRKWTSLFPDRLYMELQRTGRPNEDEYVNAITLLAHEYALPLVATNDVRFLKPDDYEAHEARVCIQQSYTLNDARRPRLYSREQYFKTSADMSGLFEDIPESIINTSKIAQRCNLELTLGEYFLPHFPVPDNKDENACLREDAERGLNKILEDKKNADKAFTQEQEEVYRLRLERELDVVNGMGFPGYFLIVADFIKWAKDQGIPVGPGRGSGAGSLVAYAIGITELDPIDYDLLFERFLNPERVSLPDFDIDFCMDRRDEVIEYVSQRYGRDRVSQIITYGSMAAKAVVRDVGRVLGQPYGFVDQIAKLIPFDIGMTLDKAMDEEPVLRKRYNDEDDVKTLIDLALKLEGLSRNAGKHAGGLIIAPETLTEYMPLYCEQGTNVTSSQFDMGDVESAGLVKFDFLGLRTLTIIDWAVKDANRLRKEKAEQALDILKIPLDDEDTYKLIQKKHTTSIFQLESDGMKRLVGDLKPDRFDDLIALVALFRPGPLQSGMVDDFVNRKHGRAKVNYPHPSLVQILQPTYGVILYQEQVMQIAQVLSGYTLGGADLLRRAMGKKKEEEMATQRSIFVEGAVKNGVEEKVATSIFNLIELFAGYGFNKSHSAAYALLSYQTAWLKTHYPAAFMAAVFSSDMDNTDKNVTLNEELRRVGVKLLPPSVNHSHYKFTVPEEKVIRFGLGAIKGVGEGAIENIVREREENGVFSTLFDLCRRIDLRKANKRVLEALIRAGALDELGPGRSSLMASLPKATQVAEQINQDVSRGQDDMFGLGFGKKEGDADPDNMSDDNFSFIETPEWDDHERLRYEKETLGFYYEGHPINRYEEELSHITSYRLEALRPGLVTIAGYIESIRVFTRNRGKSAEVRIDDRTARTRLTIFPEVLQRFEEILKKDHLILVKGEAKEDEYKGYGYTVDVKEIFTLDQIRNNNAKLRISLNQSMLENGLMSEIQTILSDYPKGNCATIIEYTNHNASSCICLGDSWKVSINDSLLTQLSGLIGEEKIKLDYN